MPVKVSSISTVKKFLVNVIELPPIVPAPVRKLWASVANVGAFNGDFLITVILSSDKAVDEVERFVSVCVFQYSISICFGSV